MGWAGRGPLLFRFIRSVRRVDRIHLFLSGLFGGHGRGGPRQRLSSELGAGSATLAPRLRLPGDGRELPAAAGRALAGEALGEVALGRSGDASSVAPQGGGNLGVECPGRKAPLAWICP